MHQKHRHLLLKFFFFCFFLFLATDMPSWVDRYIYTLIQELSNSHLEGKRAAKELIAIKKHGEIVFWILENKGWQERRYLLQAISAQKNHIFLSQLLHKVQKKLLKEL